jgi:uncharacterized repeat protein (TIGR04138 family)
MSEVSFEDAVEFIRLKDPRYQRDAYLFVREALDRTQASVGRAGGGKVRHVTGQELLGGIREHALAQFGPMAMTVLEEWGIHSCRDFGEIVFNMVETGSGASVEPGEIRDVPAFVARLKQHPDPVSKFLWAKLSDGARQAVAQSDTDATALRAMGMILHGERKPVDEKALEVLLLKDLTTVLGTSRLYDAERFAGVKLSDHAKALAVRMLKGIQLAQFNRLLLEMAYPDLVARSPGLLARTEQDSRMDFEGGYDFFEALCNPFLPSSKQHPPRRGQTPAQAPSH